MNGWLQLRSGVEQEPYYSTPTALLVLNPRRVAAELRAQTLPEATKARLILVGYLVNAVFGHAYLLRARTWGQLLLSAVAIAVVISGFWSCFKTNQAGDGRAFIERYMCVAVPLWCLIYGAYLIIYYTAYFVLRHRPGYGAADFAATVNPYFSLAAIGVLVLFFRLARRYLEFIAQP
jgi:hypothetical protein